MPPTRSLLLAAVPPVGDPCVLAWFAAVAAPEGSGSDAAETGTATPPVIPWIGRPDDALAPAAVTAVFVLIAARLPPLSSARAAVLIFVPALAVTVPLMGIATPDDDPWMVIAVVALDPTADWTLVWFVAVAAPFSVPRLKVGVDAYPGRLPPSVKVAPVAGTIGSPWEDETAKPEITG